MGPTVKPFVGPVAVLLAATTAVSGCSAYKGGTAPEPRVERLAWRAEGGVAAAIDTYEEPVRQKAVFDADFRDKRAVVVQVFVHNRGQAPVVVRRQDITLRLPDGRQIGPTTALAVAVLFESQADVVAWAIGGGLIGALAASSAAETEAKARRADYEAKELKSDVRLAPGELHHGFVFFMPPRGTRPFDDAMLSVRFIDARDAPAGTVRLPISRLGFRGATGWEEEAQAPPSAPLAAGASPIAEPTTIASLTLPQTSRRSPAIPAELRALVGNWTGTGNTPTTGLQDPTLQATITLKVAERDGQLVWDMTRVFRGQDSRFSGTVARTEDGIVLRPRQGSTAPTYTLSHRGDILDGTGLGPDNRLRTFSLTRTK